MNKNYNKTTIIALILFFPLGLYLMWAKTNWNKKVKIAISCIVGFVVLCGAVSPQSNSNEYEYTTTNTTRLTTTMRTTTTITTTTTETTEEETTEKKTEKPTEAKDIYIINVNTHKFHTEYCSSVSKMKAGNKREVVDTYSNLKSKGYSPCERCLG